MELIHSSDQTIATDNTTCEPLEPLTEMELFALDEDSECSSVATTSSASPAEFNSLDACLDACSLAKTIQSQRITGTRKHQRVGASLSDLRPMAFVRFNTRRGKPKPITIRARLDSGGSETIVTSEVAKNLKIKTLQ